MTKTIASETSTTRYFLTIDENNQAVDCTCKDRLYRHHTCKHMKAFDASLVKTECFIQLKATFDMRSARVQREKALSAARKACEAELARIDAEIQQFIAAEMEAAAMRSQPIVEQEVPAEHDAYALYSAKQAMKRHTALPYGARGAGFSMLRTA